MISLNTLFAQLDTVTEVIVPAKQYFDPLPADGWNTISEFAQWYFDNQIPLVVPWNSSMGHVDGITTAPVFRKFPYLVEMVFVLPECEIPSHYHPDLDILIGVLPPNRGFTADDSIHINLSGTHVQQLTSIQPGELYTLPPTPHGQVAIVFSKWNTSIPPKNFSTGILSRWVGATTGEVHDRLIVENASQIIQPPLLSSIPKNLAQCGYLCHPVEDLVYPTWNTIEEFSKWWIAERMPQVIPLNTEVISTDDATAICVFKHGRYQVEFYIIRPHYSIKSHSHPGMEIMTLFLGGGSTNPTGAHTFHNTSGRWGRIRAKLESGEYHGGEDTDVYSGFILCAIQKWDDGVPMTSAAINWMGPSAGPLHDELISRHTKW